MKYCSECGSSVVLRVPEGEHLPRHVCPACQTVHYQNPKIVVGCVPVDERGRILICKRAIEPRHGFWTIPAGFMENNESLEQGAARECYEEALAEVEMGSLLAIVNILHAHQVHVFFRARLLNNRYGAGPESLEVKLVEEEEIPWDEVAFASTEYALRVFLADRHSGQETYHMTSYERRGWRS